MLYLYLATPLDFESTIVISGPLRQKNRLMTCLSILIHLFRLLDSFVPPALKCQQSLIIQINRKKPRI